MASKSLESFMQGTQAARAEFTQVVTTLARTARPARQKTSSGSLNFSARDDFRFDYRKPFEQTIVADGTSLVVLRRRSEPGHPAAPGAGPGQPRGLAGFGP